MAGAAGGFVTRSFEFMLKGSAEHAALQKAVQAYLDCTKETYPQVISVGKSSIKSVPNAKSTANEVVEVIEEEKNHGNQQSVVTPEEGQIAMVDSEQTSTSIVTALASVGNTLDGAQLELVLEPIRLAFETKNIKLLESALDCLHKLIAYDHLEGDPGLEGSKNAPLFTEILTMVCNCVDNNSLDSTVLQVLKVLLTAVSSAKFRVHGEPLLGVIRVCYNISLNSKNPINQATSKAMLIQMTSIIFRRMQSDQEAHPSSSLSINPLHVEAACSENGEMTMDDQYDKRTTLGDALSMNREKDESHASVEELQNLAGGADIKGLEAVLDKAVKLGDGKKVSRGIDLESVGIGEHDALLLFRTLCKMGMKEENDAVTTKMRNLSLELLQGLLEGVSHSFTKNFHFIDSVKAYLSYALLQACVSSSSVVFQYAAEIFAILLLRFRESLKGEIGVLFPLIVLRSLDSSESSLSQRSSVLRMLEKVCKDSQMLADIFVNYDCDLEAPNLFERMVNALSRISQGMVNLDPNSAISSQTSSIKSSSLQCLVTVLKSLVDWEKLLRASTESDCISLSVEEETLAGKSAFDESKQWEESPSQFEKAKAHKSTMESIVSEFNRKPSKGIELLFSNKLVESTATSVAQFLKNTPNLDKAFIGEYLGQHEEFPLAVMHAYVDSMKFSGLKFDHAIREFLRGFRLPGEAQKIDRIMEKFAERYCADNPGLFKNAETAYILAYAVIMLNTDAHNAMVWPKMTKFDFVQMNSVSDGEECVSKELLEEIYDSIVKEEIKMKEVTDLSKINKQRSQIDERGQLVSILNLALPRRNSALHTKIESEQIVKQTQALFRKKGSKRGIFYTAQQVELVRPMLEAVGWPLLAAFSVNMEEGDNKPMVLLCMEGFKSGIHITSILRMDTMRYAFLTSLIRLTFLHAPKEMRSKNVEALRTLLALCDTEANSLQDTWNAVLESVSRLDFIISSPIIASSVMQGSNQISRDSVLQTLRELAGKPADQVFVNSARLPSDSVVEFFTALCGVSAEELKQTPARVYSLQKLVEISYYNMARIRLVWAKIWSVLAVHFISAGSHRDEDIAMYAIDSLRQLGMKYLERAELTNFTFQNDILKPFVILMRNSRSESIRGLIVDCIVQMTKSKVGSIKSGWKSVFMVFTAASDDDLEPIIERAFENIEQVILEHFDQVVGDCFMDCVNCLISFANNKTSHRISLKAIALLRICEDRLAEGLIPGGALKPVGDGLDTKFDVTEHHWFPMLAGLSDLTLDSRVEVRNCALEVLFDLLNVRGLKFSSSFWENIFHRVLFPIFDHVRHSESDSFVSCGEEWLCDTIIHSLQLLCDLFNNFYKEVSFMLPSLLSLLLDCAKKTDQMVVSISLGVLVRLIDFGGHQFSINDWDTLLRSIRDASYTTQPLELLNSLGFNNFKNTHFGRKVNEKTFDHESLSNESEEFEKNIDSSMHDVNSEAIFKENLEEFEGSSQVTAEPENLHNQTFGQRIMGNMMDNILVRSFSFKPKNQSEYVSTSASSLKDSIQSWQIQGHIELHGSSLPETLAGQNQTTLVPDAVELSPRIVEEPVLETIRSKCITQLLLIGVLDSIQRSYWNKLNPPQKIAMMDILFSVLEFASSFNSYGNLRMRLHQISSGRPPLNLLRQEMTGTSVYLDILRKTTTTHGIDETKHIDNDGNVEPNSNAISCNNEASKEDQKLRVVAEEKLVSFCEQILKDASEMYSSKEDAATVEIHRVLELRAPVVVKVLKGMCVMNSQIFQKHLGEFYPLITKLVCCDQMNIRGALADLFSTQLVNILS